MRYSVLQVTLLSAVCMLFCILPVMAADPPPEELYEEYATAGFSEVEFMNETSTTGLYGRLKLSATSPGHVEDPSAEYQYGYYSNGGVQEMSVQMTRNDHYQGLGDNAWEGGTFAVEDTKANCPADDSPFIYCWGTSGPYFTESATLLECWLIKD